MELSTSITLSAWVVAFLGGTAVPVLTGLATKLRASPGRKAFIGLALSAVVAVAASVVNGGGVFELDKLIPLFVTTFLMHVSSYYGWWKPVGGGAAPGAQATAGIGIG